MERQHELIHAVNHRARRAPEDGRSPQMTTCRGGVRPNDAIWPAFSPADRRSTLPTAAATGQPTPSTVRSARKTPFACPSTVSLTRQDLTR